MQKHQSVRVLCTDGLFMLQVLPDLTESRWSYNGTATMHDQEANTWVMESKEDLGYGEIVSTYTMYVGKVSQPRSFFCLFFSILLW